MKDWSALIPEDEWSLYREVLGEAVNRGLRFSLGGGFAYSYWSDRWRDTKDIDLYVLPEDREAFVSLLDDVGFEDFFDHSPYERGWIYRARRGGIITDVIWGMRNERAEVDERWVTAGPEVTADDLTVRIVPVEELLWAKLYVIHRDRCDWPDLMNILVVRAGELDWDHLLARVGEDRTLLAGLLCAFRWLAPAAARRVPGQVWYKLELANLFAQPRDAGQDQRARLIDYRDWFGPEVDRRAREE